MPLALAAPGDFATLSGGYLYDRRLMEELARLGAPARPVSLPAGFPAPSAAELDRAAEILDATPGPLLIDGLAYGAFSPALAARFGPRTVALVHHPLGLETGIAPARAADLIASERGALAAARGVLVTSRTTRETLIARFDVAESKIAVAEPGVDPRPRARGSDRPGEAALLAIGAVIPRKDYGLMLDALERLADISWRLDVVGSLEADRAEAARIRARLSTSPIGDRVALRGALEPAALPPLFEASDLFLTTARYEGFGMAAAEAIAHGVPVIATPAGALEETAAAGLIIRDARPAAIAAALRPILTDRAARARLADRAWAAAATQTRWSETGRAALAALRRAFGGSIA